MNNTTVVSAAYNDRSDYISTMIIIGIIFYYILCCICVMVLSRWYNRFINRDIGRVAVVDSNTPDESVIDVVVVKET
jgi:amino acid transporter